MMSTVPGMICDERALYTKFIAGQWSLNPGEFLMSCAATGEFPDELRVCDDKS